MHRHYVQHQVELLSAHLRGNQRVLDYGCGDLSLAQLLHEQFPQLRITGVDVVDPGRRPPGVRFVLSKGTSVPFASKFFDTTIAYHVFHHCDNPQVALGECARVSRKRILFVEPVFRSIMEKPLMRLADWLGNLWRGQAIPMPYEFQSQKAWRSCVTKHGWQVESVVSAGVLPSFLPLGQTLLFSVTPS